MALPSDPVHRGSAAALSPNARTWLSVAICVHLFLVVVGIAARNEVYRSPFQENLRDVPGVAAYTNLLHLDPDPLSFALTRGEPIDTDHFLEFELLLRDGRRVTVALPDRDEVSGQRARRYKRLARAAASRFETPDEATLPRSVARALCLEYEALDGPAARHVARVRWRALQQMEEVTSADPRANDPYSDGFLRTLYDADFKFFEGQVWPSKRPAALEAAPAVRPASVPASATPATSSPPGPAAGGANR